MFTCGNAFNFFTVLEIGFERMNYSYVEPEGNDTLVVDDIYVVKNIETVLTYRVSFGITATTDATRNQDFSTAPTSFDFPPTQQRLQVFNRTSDLILEILSDGLTEGEESIQIQISSAPVDNPPAYKRPQMPALTTLFILDADSENNLSMQEVGLLFTS